MPEHDTLSDAELRARLSQRNVATAEARRLVDHRDEPDAAAAIARILDGGDP